MTWIFGLLVKLIQLCAPSVLEKYANELAIRRAVLSEMVRLRIEEYSRRKTLNSDQASGMTRRVCEVLLKELDLAKIDPTSEEARPRIADAVTIAVVPLDRWIAIQRLSEAPRFSLKHYSHLQFKDTTGSTHTSQTFNAAMQNDFLYHELFAIHEDGTTKITAEVTKLANCRLRNESYEVQVFEQIVDGGIEALSNFAKPTH